MTLILNSTFQPLSVVSFKRAISLMHNKKINAIIKQFLKLEEKLINEVGNL